MAPSASVATWARLCGGDPVGRHSFVCPGPGHSSADRSLSVTLSASARDNFVVHSFAGDDPIACRDHVRAMVGLPAFGYRRERCPIRVAPWPAMSSDKSAVVARLWRKTRPIEGTLGELYLRSVRGISCKLPATMRFLAALGDHAAAIVMAFGFPSEPEPGVMSVVGMDVRALHLTRVETDGTKREKRMLGSPSGFPLVVAPPTETGRGLVIAEGIEDAMSAHEATGLAAWAAGSAAHMAKLATVVPAWAETVVIMRDDNDAGRRATAALAEALRRRGLKVVVWGGVRG